MATKPICEFSGCDKPHHAKGLCHTHYEAVRLGRAFSAKRNSVRTKNKGMKCSADGCDRPSAARGMCRAHHAKFKLGQRHQKPPAQRGELLKWIRQHLSHKGEECLIWPFGRDQKGYGAVKFEGVQTNAHRVMCILAHGRPPSGKEQSAHSCGQGHAGCVNPNHLSWKSAKENCADREMHNSITCREDG